MLVSLLYVVCNNIPFSPGLTAANALVTKAQFILFILSSSSA